MIKFLGSKKCVFSIFVMRIKEGHERLREIGIN